MGTLVLTRSGYTPIGDILPGHDLLTATRGWCSVADVSRKTSPLTLISSHVHHGLVLGEDQPLLARECATAGSGPSGNVRIKRALDVGPGRWNWAVAASFPFAHVPAFVDMGVVLLPDLCWLAGLYLSQGVEADDDRLMLQCAHRDSYKLRVVLSGLRWSRPPSSPGPGWSEEYALNSVSFCVDHPGLMRWLHSHFGVSSHSRRIPAWVLGMDLALRQAFLVGFLSIGWRMAKPQACFKTELKSVFFGLSSLLISMGYSIDTYTMVEKGRSQYVVLWSVGAAGLMGEVKRENGLLWCRVFRSGKTQLKADVVVVALNGATDYVVEGVIACCDRNESLPV